MLILNFKLPEVFLIFNYIFEDNYNYYYIYIIESQFSYDILLFLL